MGNYKTYYDTNGKEAVDITGVKPEAEVIAECGLVEAGCQIVTYEPDQFATEVVGGTLQTFDHVARGEADSTAKEVERQAAEDATKTNLSLDQQGYDDLVRSMS